MIQGSLWKRGAPRVGVLGYRRHRDNRGDYFGLDAVVDELSVNVRPVNVQTWGDADIVIASLMSPMDVLDFVAVTSEAKRHARLVVGGQGVYSFLGWAHLTDRIMFGRAEDAVDAIVLMTDAREDCYDYRRDPDVHGRYLIRQARRLLPGERSVGCNGGCRFCQYGSTRRLVGLGYHPTSRGARVVEDRWGALNIYAGSQTTALDGWSEETRTRVGKPVSDEEIVDSLSRIVSAIDGVMRLKVFQIVGYPWETPESVREDILRLSSTLSRVRPGPGRVVMMFTVTPFSPEPLTAMEDEPANVTTQWRDVLLHQETRCVVDLPHLNAFILPQIPGPLTLLRRVAVNRGADVDTLLALRAASTIDDGLRVVGHLAGRGEGRRVSGILRVEDYEHPARLARAAIATQLRSSGVDARLAGGVTC
jgi:hypothetical protein